VRQMFEKTLPTGDLDVDRGIRYGYRFVGGYGGVV
jgi:hypothetical protein